MQFMYFNQNEIRRGVGENALGKATRKDYRRGTGNPRDIRFFPFIVCKTPILLLCFNPFNTPTLINILFLITLSLKASSCKKGARLILRTERNIETMWK